MPSLALTDEIPEIDEVSEASTAKGATAELAAKSAVIGVFDLHVQAEEDVIKFECYIEADRLLVMAYGISEEVARAGYLMEQEKAAETAVIEG